MKVKNLLLIIVLLSISCKNKTITSEVKTTEKIVQKTKEENKENKVILNNTSTEENLNRAKEISTDNIPSKLEDSAIYNPSNLKKMSHKEIQNIIPELAIEDMIKIDQWVNENPKAIYTVNDNRYMFHYMHFTLKEVHEYNQKQEINIVKNRWTLESSKTNCSYLAKQKIIRYTDVNGYKKQDIGDGFYGFPEYRGETTSWGGGKYQSGSKMCAIQLKSNIKMLRFKAYQERGFWSDDNIFKKGIYYLYLAHNIDALELPTWPLIMVMNTEIINKKGTFYVDFNDRLYQNIEPQSDKNLKKLFGENFDLSSFDPIKQEGDKVTIE